MVLMHAIWKLESAFIKTLHYPFIGVNELWKLYSLAQGFYTMSIPSKQQILRLYKDILRYGHQLELTDKNYFYRRISQEFKKNMIEPDPMQAKFLYDVSRIYLSSTDSMHVQFWVSFFDQLAGNVFVSDRLRSTYIRIR